MRRNMGRRSNIGNTGGGPLMTGHLQDIDLELELLKRKREMIEQQQQLLVMEQQFKSSRHSYDQMRYDELDQHGSNRDFTHLYDSGPKYRNQFGKKRQAENNWQYEGPSKRTPIKKKSNQSQFIQHVPGNTGPANIRNQRPSPSQGSKYPPKGPTPLMEAKIKPFIGQRIANQKPLLKMPNKDFVPAKVSKPKATPAPNKLASHTVTERKSLVAAATESSKDGDVSRMLLPDRVPTLQVSGRLELALGAIMKNIRTMIDDRPEHGTILRSIQLQRVMKQAVRERIRTVMLGKVVGSLLEILAIYREEFPEETDADILNIALEAGGVSAKQEQKQESKFIESEDPVEFFKTNMNCLLETNLKEMFTKLEEIYGESTGIMETPGEVDLKLYAEKNKERINNKEHAEFLNSSIKVHQVKRILPRLMKRYVPYMVKLINADAMYQTTKAAITMKANEKAANIFGNKGSENGQVEVENSSPVPENSTVNRQMYNLPYYVKIMGRPSLPKRKVMQAFLSQFKPKSIKKHRTIHNLLFVGFTEKTDFDVMVGADGTVIGRSTLSVRICSKEPQEPNASQNIQNNDSNFAMDMGQDKGELKDNDVINADLDCQITDLLSSIRKSEEEDKENSKNTSVEIDNDGGEEKINTTDEEKGNTEKEGDNNKDKENNENDNAENNADELVDDENAIATEEMGDDDDAQEDKGDSDEPETNNSEPAIESEIQNSEPANESEIQNSEPTNESGTQKSEPNNETQNAELNNESEIQNMNANTENSGKPINTQKSEVIDNTEKTEDSEESKKAEPSSQETNKEETSALMTEEQCDDKVGELKSAATGRSTPSRTSARLANVTPSTIRTRRASRLAQN